MGPRLERDDAEVIDATGDIVIPGFVDTHRHTWEAAIRGCAPDATLDDYFVEVLDSFAPVYRPEDVYASNLAGALECVNTGHPGAMLIRPDGQVRLLQCAENPPLGVDMGPLVCQSESMAENELLVMYTDGLSDLSDSMGTRLGTDTLRERLQEIYREDHKKPVIELGEKLTQMLDNMMASAMAVDDRTFLLARRA